MQTAPPSLKFATHQINFDFLHRHKLLALACSRGWLRKHPLLSADEKKAAEQRLAMNVRREAFMRGLLAEVAARCADLEVGVLKGPALWGDIYQPGERESCDIDLFVARENAETLLKRLAGLGYRAVPGEAEGSPLHDFKTVCLSENHGDLSIEIHTKLWWREPAGFAWRWRAEKPEPLLRLVPEDQLLHLCGHWIAQHTMISMHWMLDIALFLEAHRTEVDPAALRERAKVLRLGRAVELALRICEDFSSGRDSRLRRMVTIDLDFLLEPRKKLARYFFIKHAVQESWLDALLYDMNWVRSRLGGRA